MSVLCRQPNNGLMHVSNRHSFDHLVAGDADGRPDAFAQSCLKEMSVIGCISSSQPADKSATHRS
jgi:hypothetical protein